MRNFIAQQTLFIFLHSCDNEKIILGQSVAERYNGEHKIHISLPSEHIASSESDWIKMVCNPTVEFISQNGDFNITLSLYDVRNSFISVLNFEGKFIPNKCTLFRNIVVFLPDVSQNDGYALRERYDGYVPKPRLHPRKAA